MRRLALLAFASVACLASEAGATSLNSKGIATDLSFIEAQATKTLHSLGSPTAGYPVSGGDTGTWTTTSPSSESRGWASGFFPGELWLLYQATGSPQWLAAAQAWTAPLASQASLVTQPRVDPTDVGFIIGTSFGNGYRLTGDPADKQALVTAAGSLASLYNTKVGAVRSWTFPQFQFPVIVDSMMTLGPLQWAAGADGTIATTHAQTVTRNLVRSNGSTYQLADFNPTTGAPASPEYYETGGLSATSVWARGQAWALYGFVQAYETSHNPAFLTTAESVANYFIANLPKRTDIPPWDFDAPASSRPPVDTSAAAIAADGLVMLSTVSGTSAAQKTYYLSYAEAILGSLSNSYLDRSSVSGESVLIDGFPGLNGTNTALIYGDYYFTEALLRLQDVLDGQPGWVLYGPTAPAAAAAAFATPAVAAFATPAVAAFATPEPSTWAMMLLGFGGLCFAGYRRRARPSSARM